ncbi:Uncharacterized protein BM_BM625 [Brugia malayi]|uniref:Bm625 n=1 Tax=Brugia malayi TaxID=6279 RepID=A0A0K0JMC7_BRUMA|nr:Uncharacterized protein BM_BM625 [Brugia malayi]CDP99320.1 Bm625 [Brugia malayi]VIO90793.1 Uncharacterized protein BM_BM625 [Brugia malayi]
MLFCRNFETNAVFATIRTFQISSQNIAKAETLKNALRKQHQQQ